MYPADTNAYELPVIYSLMMQNTQVLDEKTIFILCIKKSLHRVFLMRHCPVLNRSIDDASLKDIAAIEDPTTLRRPL